MTFLKSKKRIFMLGIDHTYYFYLSVVDIHKEFNGLKGLVSEHMD